MAEYILMNKDTPVAKLGITHGYSKILEVYSELPPYLANISDWIDSRATPIGRENIGKLMKIAQLHGRTDYLTLTKGISLIDTFWFKQADDTYTTWDKINPYKNRFSKIVSNIALNGEYLGGNIKSPSPDYQVDGSVDKCWKRKNGKILLYKTAGEKWSGSSGNRPYCEHYASQVAEALCIDKSHFVKYGIEVGKTQSGYNKPYSICELFTNENMGYAALYTTKFKDNTIKELDKILDEKSRYILREMLILDSIILNFDRHQGNYGFLVDNTTYNIIGLNPIFDNDCSLGALESLQHGTIKEVYENLKRTRQPSTDMGGYTAQARWAMTRKLYNNMKNMYPFHFKRLPGDIDIEDERIQFMEYIVNSQIRNIIQGKE